MKTEQKQMYEERLRHLETPEFVMWFETWYAKEEEYGDNDSLRDMYLLERNFALAGWLAAKTGMAHMMTKEEFVLKALPMSNAALSGAEPAFRRSVRSKAQLYVETEMETFVCKCCGKDARWCGEGPDACSTGHDCDHIHCDHCGMHYSLESKEAIGAETIEEMRALMRAAYNAQ